MNIHMTGRQVELTQDIRDFCERKLKSLEKLLGSALEVDLILSVEKYRNKVEINVKHKGGRTIVVEEASDMMSALGLAFESLAKKMKKEKEKYRAKKRRKGREQKTFPPAPEAAESERRVIHSRDYSLKPMSLDEALIQFDLEKRDIFVFRKVGSEKFAVIYRRKDGNVGVIEPE